MKTKLFENRGGNNFRLLKESKDVNESLIASGLKKVFMNAGDKISYSHVEAVGMGYIKDVSTAKRTALQEARILAEEFGYKDNEEDAKFVKDSANTLPLKKEHDETDMSNPEERTEMQIGEELVKLATDNGAGRPSGVRSNWFPNKVAELGNELIKMHGQKK